MMFELRPKGARLFISLAAPGGAALFCLVAAAGFAWGGRGYSQVPWRWTNRCGGSAMI